LSGDTEERSEIEDLRHRLAEAEARVVHLGRRLEERESLARLGVAAEHVGDSIEFTDVDGTMVWVNPAYELLTGYTRVEVLGKTPGQLLRSDEHPPSFFEEIWAITSSGKIWKGLITSCRKDGSVFTADCTLSPVFDGEGDMNGFMCLRRDVTHEVQERKELRNALSRYALAAAGANDGMWGWDLQTDELLLSASWRLMLGYDAREHRGDPTVWLRQVHPNEREALKTRLDAHIAGESDHVECEYRIRHADGGWRWMLCRGVAERDELGVALRLAGSQADITRQKTAELRLRHEALHDALTGLPNRVLFEDRLQQALFRASRSPGRQVAVLFVDLDRFKNINDSFGHATGDRLLQEVASRLLRAVRSADSVARIGGDEFTVLLDGVRHDEEVAVVTRRIREAVRLPVTVAGNELVVSASIGVTLSGDQGFRPEDLLREADTAMYRAKAAGRDKIISFEPSMREAVVGLVELERQLRQGIGRGELLLHYQPIVELPSCVPIGYEALVRWNRPGHGVVLPGEFLAVAEEAGLMDELERWVLLSACDQISRWRASGELPDGVHVSVNISPDRLVRPHLVEEVQKTLRRTGVPPRALRLEITESSLLHDETAAANALRELRGLGIEICLDDFGTGYSSLSYIHRFPVDVVKIDRSFISGLPLDASSEAIVRAIVGMASGLGMQVVAEGVETPEQLRRLIDLGCDAAQGFHLGRPEGPEQLAEAV
jgi:diguanylate cyclase (GGDEF)-like protein/PAS domain S-box-containing protein